jgi:hypothetical protein
VLLAAPGVLDDWQIYPEPDPRIRLSGPVRRQPVKRDWTGYFDGHHTAGA